MNIGTVKQNEQGIFTGRVSTLALSLVIGLAPVNSSNAKAPVYDIMGLSADRRTWVKIGALWEFASNETGEAFFSGRMDDPSLTEPLQVAFFAQRDGSMNIAWQREKTRANMPTSAARSSEDALPPMPGASDSQSDDSASSANAGLGESTASATRKAAAREKDLVTA
jgi:uncharacterized protein (DUF736 family)